MSHPEFLPARDKEGTLTLDIVTGDSVSRLRTVAPFAEVQVNTEPHYAREHREIDFGPGYFVHPPELEYIDLTVRVRLRAGSTPDGTLYQMILTPPAETLEQTIQRVIDYTEAADIGTQSAADNLVAELMAELKKRGHIS